MATTVLKSERLFILGHLKVPTQLAGVCQPLRSSRAMWSVPPEIPDDGLTLRRRCLQWQEIKRLYSQSEHLGDYLEAVALTLTLTLIGDLHEAAL